jgi:hypothetical protein
MPTKTSPSLEQRLKATEEARIKSKINCRAYILINSGSDRPVQFPRILISPTLPFGHLRRRSFLEAIYRHPFEYELLKTPQRYK